jgi:hypothetical protein
MKFSFIHTDDITLHSGPLRPVKALWQVAVRHQHPSQAVFFWKGSFRESIRLFEIGRNSETMSMCSTNSSQVSIDSESDMRAPVSFVGPELMKFGAAPPPMKGFVAMCVNRIESLGELHAMSDDVLEELFHYLTPKAICAVRKTSRAMRTLSVRAEHGHQGKAERDNPLDSLIARPSERLCSSEV